MPSLDPVHGNKAIPVTSFVIDSEYVVCTGTGYLQGFAGPANRPVGAAVVNDTTAKMVPGLIVRLA